MDTAVRDPLVGRLVDGRYAVRARVARGGMATVYLATDTRLERDVALKVMHPHLADDEQFVARFHREAKSAARLSCPSVVAVFDQGADGDTVYLAMEYLPGSTLRDLLAGGPLTPREALGVLEPVLDALAAAHRAGVVHRDVKPENVLLADDGRVKVADFGLARAASGAASGTSQSTLIGTVAYLSPELVLRGVADARSDVYAAGVMLFEMLTGRQPFAGEVPVHVAYQHVNGQVPAPSSIVPGLAEALDELVLWATARDADDRPEDARALLAEVREVRAALTEAELDLDPAPARAVPGTDPPADGRTLPVPRHDSALALPVGEPEGVPAGDTAEQRWASRTLGARLGRRGGRRGRGRWLTWGLALVTAVALAGAGWWFAAGPGAYTSTPDVTGRTQVQAEQLLSAAGLDATVRERFDDAAPEGQVLDTDPGPGADVRRGGVVQVLVSAGPEFVPVPALAGTPVDQALASLEAAGLAAGAVTEEYSEEVPQGVVVAQSVPAEQTLRRSEPVDLVVSLGREPLDVPQLSGLPRDEAEAALVEAGLALGEVTSQPSEDVAEGVVLTQVPDDGTLFRGDPVAVVVSSGPPLVAVPQVRGLQLDEAVEAVEAAGLVPEVERVLGGVFGTVHSTEPAEGSEVRKGSTVTIRVV